MRHVQNQISAIHRYHNYIMQYADMHRLRFNLEHHAYIEILSKFAMLTVT